MEQTLGAGTADWQARKEALRQALRQAQAEPDETVTDADDEVDDDSEDVDDVEVEGEIVVEVEPSDDDTDDDDGPDEDDDDEADDEIDVVEVSPSEPQQQGRKRKGKKLAKLYREIEELKQGSKQAIEDAIAAREAARERDAELQRERDKATERDRLNAERVNRLVGDDREYDQLLAEITADEDVDPLTEPPEVRSERNRKKARVREIQNNRTSLDTLQSYAEQTVQERAGTILRELAKSLPGVDPTILDRENFANSIASFHTAGRAVEAAARSDEIDLLKKDNLTLRGQISALRSKKGAPLKRVAEGGASIPPTRASKSDNPAENLREMGLIDKNGRISADAREKIRSGRLNLLG